MEQISQGGNQFSGLDKPRLDSNIEFKETDYFTYFDYIEGLGLDRNVSEMVFSLDKDQIHPEALSLENGVYIIKLLELTPVDESLFVEKKDEYVKKLEQSNKYSYKVMAKAVSFANKDKTNG